MKTSLEQNDIRDFGKILNEGWMKKRELAGSISNPMIDRLYDVAIGTANVVAGKASIKSISF